MFFIDLIGFWPSVRKNLNFSEKTKLIKISQGGIARFFKAHNISENQLLAPYHVVDMKVWKSGALPCICRDHALNNLTSFSASSFRTSQKVLLCQCSHLRMKWSWKLVNEAENTMTMTRKLPEHRKWKKKRLFPQWDWIPTIRLHKPKWANESSLPCQFGSIRNNRYAFRKYFKRLEKYKRQHVSIS